MAAQDPTAFLKERGYQLVAAPPPAGSYVGYRLENGLLFVSGQLPLKAGSLAYKGKVGQDISLEDGQAAAELCAFNILTQVNQAIDGDWSRVQAVMRLNGFVNCAPDFTDHPKVINGASDFMVAALGPAGAHTRIALGAVSLPLGASVEIDAVLSVA